MKSPLPRRPSARARPYSAPERMARRLRRMREDLEPGGCDLTALWKARAWRTARGDGPMRQARVFAAVLSRLPVVVHPDEPLVGSSQAALSRQRPASVDETTFKDAQRVVREDIMLPFSAHGDHACPDYATLLHDGVDGILGRIRARRARPCRRDQDEYLCAMEGCWLAFRDWIQRHAAACVSRSDGTASRLEWIAGRPPRTLQEALQLVWLADLALALEGRGAMAFGRMDQYLAPFYRRDIDAGVLDRSGALDLLACFYARLEEPLRQNPINNIAVGGLTPDGRDATNELSFLLLEAADIIRSTRHNLTARWHDRTPHRFKEACMKLIRTGIGFPAIVNDDVAVGGLLRLGLPPEDARDYCFVGCIETFIPGKTGPWADSRFNLLKVLEDHLRACTGRAPATYEGFENGYLLRVERDVHAHADAVVAHESGYDYRQRSAPFMSALVQDCIARAADVNAGGARYAAMHGIAGMGLATVADSLQAVRTAVYRDRRFSLDELMQRLEADFAGYEKDRLHLQNKPAKYGNGSEEVDAVAGRVAAAFGRATLSRRNALGGRFLPLLAANTANIAAGAEVGASPDGRRAREPLSDAASPHFGRDRSGPAGVIESLARVDYFHSIGGNVVNMKLDLPPDAPPDDVRAFIALVTAYFNRGGMQLQFNTVSRDTLLRALHDPASHADLIVRVSGFSAHFIRLDSEIQHDILNRTEHRFSASGRHL